MNRARLAALLILIVGACATIAVVPLVMRLVGDPVTGPGGLDGEGGTIAWTVDTANGSRDAWVFGDTAVVLDGTSLLGLRRGDGGRVWQLPYPAEDTALTVAGGVAVVQAGTDGPVDVIDPASGRTLWSAAGPVRMVARADALYLDSCPDRRDTPADCVLTKRRVADGATLWTMDATHVSVHENVIGARRPLAPPASAYLPVSVSEPGVRAALLDTTTGTVLPGRAEQRAWYTFAAGDTLVVTDHDPPRGDRDCTVTVTAVHARTGAAAWDGAIHSGRTAGGECTRSFPRIYSGSSELFGVGNEVAAVTRSGQATLVDVTTGETRWTTPEQGVPIAGDDESLLVRANAETGPIALLALADGRRLWSAPDTGLATTSASWEAVAHGDLVAVLGATGDRPYVLVYDARTGRQLARRGGWLTGVGEGWVMVSTGAGAGRLRLHMLTF
ncbi:outer membrane protein assembly factor BamB family protein [Catenuloplanes indicus]|uniref:Outer membrane protein assembly factor BamB n=1 Tax=Catenuloplanes indicus TaxID=137267 RepID=A0AAE4B144_9ACTN|nr:PQQ-binding-like beta-propeller repeat protein [Catenuloplanes indicus]MDQ0370264.1 outer membrane protein assembly factor BamB [Catenuloplanes indicus]